MMKYVKCLQTDRGYHEYMSEVIS